MRILFNGKALYAEQDRLWVARGMSFFAIDYNGKRVTPKYCVGNYKQKLMSCSRLSRQLLREGIHHLIPLKNGDIFLTTKRKSYTVDREGCVKHIFSGYKGNKPGHQGVCMSPNGDIFFGEYTLNLKRENNSVLYRSTDNGMSFQPIFVLPKNLVRHIHFIKYDPYEKCLWLGTGDKDQENFLMRSSDNGETWDTIGGGSQDWRAIGVCFTEDALIWGTDAGSVPEQNHIIRMDRKTKKLEILANAEGPCHGCAGFMDGRVYVSTGVEGGENELDRSARLKQITKSQVITLFEQKKDIFPFIIQYGVMRFPLGTENTDKIIFTMMGLKHGAEKVVMYE